MRISLTRVGWAGKTTVGEKLAEDRFHSTAPGIDRHDDPGKVDEFDP